MNKNTALFLLVTLFAASPVWADAEEVANCLTEETHRATLLVCAERGYMILLETDEAQVMHHLHGVIRKAADTYNLWDEHFSRDDLEQAFTNARSRLK